MTTEIGDAFFREATATICKHLQPEDGLRGCAELLSKMMPVGQMYLEVYEHDLGAIRSIARATPETGESMDMLVTMTAAQRKVVTSFRNQSPTDNVFIVNQPKADPVSRAMLDALKLPLETSVLGTYPSIENEVVGSVVVTAPGEFQFTEEHAALFGLLKVPFAVAIQNAARYREILRLKDLLDDDNRFLHQELIRDSGIQIIGADFGLRDVIIASQQVALHDSPVLLMGETGVGKDVIANHIHQISNRCSGPMIKVNCGAIPDSLMDSELFGHEKGAFTGALQKKRGRFERAHGGTIFLDEIGELTLPAQTRLLRILQSKEIERVGGEKTIEVDIRVIAATHRDLREMVRQGEFREDLWYRLNVFPINIPPLRTRKEDIPALTEFLVQQKCKRLNLIETPRMSPAVIDQLVSYDWPGNVRELENVIERSLILSGGRELRVEDLLPNTPRREQPQDSILSGSRPMTLDEVTRKYIIEVLSSVDGKVHGSNGAAAILNVNPSTLRSRMNKLGIVYGRRS
ncbi:sigma-54 interaction domain-containing protein [Vibrio sp. HN007]|uniref:sigma-54 interaction domain-containing protein n=1 Tax=Vibrio iocasae TaxID=3098914 RepID=UPI0035D4694F